MKTVDIFGTCFTRELFNQTNQYKVNTYLMQQSIYTINSKPYNISPEEISTKDNYMFKNRMIYYDFNKLAFNKLRENPSEYLIIDLTDQIRDIIILSQYENIKVTSTSSMLENLKRLNINYSIEDTTKYSNEILINYLKQFINIILSLYDKNKIILNKVQMQSIYYENNERKEVDKNNFVCERKHLLAHIEQLFLELFPECRTLYTNHEPLVDINHRFGLHPMHFEQIYYKYRMDLLDAIINNKDINEIDKNYEQEYNQSIKHIKSKTLKL